MLQDVTGTLIDNGLNKEDDTDNTDDTNDDSDTDADNSQDTDEHIWKQHAGLWHDFQVKWRQFWILLVWKLLDSSYVMARNHGKKSVKKTFIGYELCV